MKTYTYWLLAAITLLSITSQRATDDIYEAHDEIPLYFCTGANDRYYPHLLNLIGSIHRTSYKNLGEIAVFDLGLTPEQRRHIARIDKVKLHRIREELLSSADILRYRSLPNGHRVFGWYAWKPIAIKQALETYPYVLWIDAGSTVRKPLDHLFAYIDTYGLFACTIGDEVNSKKQLLHPLKWGTTKFVIQQFNLSDTRNNWILEQEFIMANLIGVSQAMLAQLVMPWYELTKDLRYFEDDGSTPNGYGTGRHDQTLLSILVYKNNLPYFKQDYTQNKAMTLPVTRNNDASELYVTWHPDFVCSKTHIYSSRGDLSKYKYYTQFIKYKHKQRTKAGSTNKGR